MKKSLFLWLLILGFSTVTFAATMVSNGKSSWQIVISPGATSTEVYAANELQTHLLELTKAKLPIVKSDTIPAKNAIVIGFAKTMPALPADLTKFETAEQDILRVVCRNGKIYCVGNSHRSALYAVYAFLKKVCGVRWYRPGKGWDGTYIPKKAVIAFSDKLDFTEKSSFKYRGLHLCGRHYDHEMETWMTRNRINIMCSDPPTGRHKWRKAWNDIRISKGLYMQFATHNVAIYDKKVFAEHPEYFAEINGKRIPDQLCWSNPTVDKILIDRFVKDCKSTPQLEILSLSAADNMNYCRCSKCGKLPVNELWFALYQRIIDGIAKECPNIKFSTIAYQAYLAPPKKPLRNVEFIKYCMYNRCYVHNLKDCSINERPMKQIKEWQAKGVPVLVYGYEFDIFKPTMQPPFYHMLADQTRWMKPARLVGAIPEVIPPAHRAKIDPVTTGKMYELGYYVYAALLWKHDAKVEDIIAEYSAAAYGAAAKEMTSYALKLADAWRSMKIHYSYFYNSPLACSESFLNAKLISDLDALFRKANNAARSVKCPVERKRISDNIAAEKAVFDLWVKTYRDFTASKANSKITVPRTRKGWDFSNAVQLPTFKTRGTVIPKTVAKINYDSKYLYFDVTCHDKNLERLVTRHTQRDSNVYNDDCIELFIAVPNDIRGIYRHLVINSAGAKYDSIALGGHTFDLAWNPEYEVRATKGKDYWRLQFAIPFAELGNTPKAGDQWTFSLKRTTGGRNDIHKSGYPDPTYHDQNAFAVMLFSPFSKPVNMVYFNPGKEVDVNEMKMLFEQSGFVTKLYRDMKTFSKHKGYNDIYIIRARRGYKFDQKLFDNEITPALKKGALVFITGWSEVVAPDKFFRNPDLALKWAGWKIARKRKSLNVKQSSWLTTPNDIRNLVNKGMTPAGGFYPVKPEAWENLASLPMADGSAASFLLARKMGKGLLIVGCVDLGMAGGIAMFGNRKQQSQQLLENLYALLNN